MCIHSGQTWSDGEESYCSETEYDQEDSGGRGLNVASKDAREE